MKSTILSVATLAGTVTASLQLDYANIKNAPLPSVTAAPVLGTPGAVPFNSAAVASSMTSDVQPTSAPDSSSNKLKRQNACAAEPAGTGPTVSPDTDTAFEKYPYWSFLADSAYPPYPYQEVFRDLNGSTSQNSYITYYVLPSYNATQCADYCNAISTCTAFNLYVERDPSVVPGPDCPNPPSVSNYKCALWGSTVSAATATNEGQYQEDFHVVIAGSNGYDKVAFTTPPFVNKFALATNLSTTIITNDLNFLGSEFFAGPYEPGLCGDYATAQTAANQEAAQDSGASSYQAANMFNAYMVYQNEVAWGTACALFNTPLNSSDAGNVDGSDGDDYYTVDSSWTYVLDPQDAGTL